MIDTFEFSVITGDKVTPSLWREASDLFSSEYGFYSASAPQRAGQQIRMGVRYYQGAYASSDYRVAFCRDGGKLVAQAIYREFVTDRGRVAFVVQLVVAKDYRKRGIASTLLHAVWGFTDYYAWGIVTSNAFTVETLEAATFRRVDPVRIADRAEWLRRSLLSKIAFLAASPWRIGPSLSCVASEFYTDRSDQAERAKCVSSRLGVLEEGEEWLAVVFRDQVPDDFTSYQAVVSASSRFAAEAYRRMPQSEQPWAQETESEVEAVLKWLPDISVEARIADFGSGSGRHLAALRKRGFKNLVGIDYAVQQGADAAVEQGDCRTWRSSTPFDVILCLYDVIGSFVEDEDNKAILKNIAANLKDGGAAVLSVSNIRYLDRTKVAEIDFGNPEAAAAALFSLRPSKTMWEDGEFFRPECVLVDKARGLVCHKEKFPASDASLPGEYLIRDRRFRVEEIVEWAEECGLTVAAHHFVRAGFKAELPEGDGKEILLITRRNESKGRGRKQVMK